MKKETVNLILDIIGDNKPCSVSEWATIKKELAELPKTPTNKQRSKCLGCKYESDGRRMVPCPCSSCSRFWGDNWQK